MSRFPPVPPSQLTEEQQKIYAISEPSVAWNENAGVVCKNKDGAFLGPYAPLHHLPFAISDGFATMYRGIQSIPGLPPAARETAILVTGSHYGAVFEIYAHERHATATTDMTQEQVDTIKAGKKPEGLNKAADVAYEVAKRLTQFPGPLDDGLWSKAVEVMGKEGATAVVQFVAVYSYVSVLLNGSDVPLPEGESIR